MKTTRFTMAVGETLSLSGCEVNRLTLSAADERTNSVYLSAETPFIDGQAAHRTTGRWVPFGEVWRINSDLAVICNGCFQGLMSIVVTLSEGTTATAEAAICHTMRVAK
jgi:hypothetical protein